jgi:hypothetical protein
MKFRLALLTTFVVVATATLGAFASTATAQPPDHDAVANITPAQSGGVLNGTFTITSFTVNDANQLVANGVFTGTATVGGVTQAITSAASAPITTQQANTCRILDLVLGPLHLDLLGLVIDLNQVHLTITAERGPGNLLGNLLCAVAGLLDPASPGGGNAIDRLLDLINRLLGG